MSTFKDKAPKDWGFDDTRAWLADFKSNYEDGTEFDFAPTLVSKGSQLVIITKENFVIKSPLFGIDLYDNLQSLINNQQQPQHQPQQQVHNFAVDTKFSINGAILPHDRNTTYFWIETSCEDLIRQVSQGEYVCLYAPRSSSKTTTTYRMCELLGDQYYPIFLSFDRNYMFGSVESFWNSMARDLKISMRRNEPLAGLDDVLTLFSGTSTVFHGKKVVLLIDEFDSIFNSDMYNDDFFQSSEVLNSLLTQLRAWKQTSPEQKVLHSVVAIGTFSILEMTTTDHRISPFSTPSPFEVPSFTLSNVVNLFHLYANKTGVKIAPEVVQDIFSLCNGHPGLINYCGRLIQTICAKNKQTFEYQDWTELSTVGIFSTVDSYSTIRQMCRHLNYEGPFFERARKYLFMCVMAYPDPIQSNPSNSKYFKYLTSEGFLNAYQDTFIIRSRLLKNITYFFAKPRGNIPSHITVPFKMDHLEQIDVVSLVLYSLKYLDKETIINTKSLKSNRANGYTRDAPVPSESVYHFGLFSIIQLIGVQSNLPSFVYPEVTSKSGGKHDRRADMLIRYKQWSAVLELVAHQPPQGVEEHLDSALDYKTSIKAKEAWVINFTCGPIEKQIESKDGVGLIHVCHTRDYSNVQVKVHYPNTAISQTYQDKRHYPLSLTDE